MVALTQLFLTNCKLITGTVAGGARGGEGGRWVVRSCTEEGEHGCGKGGRVVWGWGSNNVQSNHTCATLPFCLIVPTGDKEAFEKANPECNCYF